MADDEKVKVVIEGDASDATQAISGVGDSLDTLQNAFKTAFEITGIAAAIESVKKLGEALSQAAERATQINVSSQSLGISVTEFQGLQVMAAQAGVSTETLGRSLATLQSRMAQAGEQGGQAAEKFNALGITTEQLRDPTFTVIDAMEEMGAKSNSNAAIMAELGARGRMLIPILRELAENHNAAAEAAEKAGALTKAEIAGLESYHAQVEITDMAWDNFKARVLTGVMPAMQGLLQQLGSFAADSDNAAAGATTFKIAIETVGEEVFAFIAQLKDVVDAFFAIGRIGYQTFAGLGAAATDAAHGHFKQAGNDIMQIGADVKASWQAMFTSFEENAKEAGTRLTNLQDAVERTPTAPPPAAAAAVGGVPDLSGDAAKLQSVMDRVWDEIEKGAASKMKEAFKEIEASAADSAKGQETAEVGSIDRQIAAVEQLAKTHQITNSQELTQVTALLNQKWDAEKAYFDKVEALYANDPVKLAEIEKQEETAWQAHLDAMQKAQERSNQQMLASEQAMVNGLSSALSSNLQKMLAGTETFGQAMRNIFAKMVDGIISSLVKVAVQYAINAAISQETGQSAARSNVLANAAQAASGAMASAAAIPYIGWIIAPIEGAAIYAAALAFPSAAGGWDIPTGINPVTQLHSGEMVLPQKFADVFRGLAEGQGAGKSGGNHTINLSATDAKSFERQLTNSSSAISMALKQHLSRGGR